MLAVMSMSAYPEGAASFPATSVKISYCSLVDLAAIVLAAAPQEALSSKISFSLFILVPHFKLLLRRFHQYFSYGISFIVFLMPAHSLSLLTCSLYRKL
jgi:hypothetical protein